MGRAEKPSSVTRSEDERIENSPSEIRGHSLVRTRSAKEITMKVIPSSIANPFIKAHHYSGKVVNNSKLHGKSYNKPNRKSHHLHLTCRY